MNYLIDIEGTITEDVPNAVETINRWYDEGHGIYFSTTRTEEMRQITVDWLVQSGFKYHALIMGKPSGDFQIICNHKVRAIQFNGKFKYRMDDYREMELFKEKLEQLHIS